MYVHTARKEITRKEALEKAASPDMTKHILKVRVEMVKNMYKYFDSGLSESHRRCISVRFSTQGSRTTTCG